MQAATKLEELRKNPRSRGTTSGSEEVLSTPYCFTAITSLRQRHTGVPLATSLTSWSRNWQSLPAWQLRKSFRPPASQMSRGQRVFSLDYGCNTQSRSLRESNAIYTAQNDKAFQEDFNSAEKTRMQADVRAELDLPRSTIDASSVRPTPN